MQNGTEGSYRYPNAHLNTVATLIFVVVALHHACGTIASPRNNHAGPLLVVAVRLLF